VTVEDERAFLSHEHAQHRSVACGSSLAGHVSAFGLAIRFNEHIEHEVVPEVDAGGLTDC
jgi:hypothetical protein